MIQHKNSYKNFYSISTAYLQCLRELFFFSLNATYSYRRSPFYTKSEMSNFLHLRILLRANGAKLICKKMIKIEMQRQLAADHCQWFTQKGCSCYFLSLPKSFASKIWCLLKKRLTLEKCWNFEFPASQHLRNFLTANVAKWTFTWFEDEHFEKKCGPMNIG